MIHYQEFEKVLRQGRDSCRDKVKKEIQLHSFDNIDDRMAWWACFDQDQSSAALPPDAPTPPLAASRRKGLKKMGADASLPAVIEIWKKHLGCIVPDPADSLISHHTEYAEWMKALYELNRGEYGKLLAQWQKKHKRRRNLWRDMNALGLSI